MSAALRNRELRHQIYLLRDRLAWLEVNRPDWPLTAHCHLSLDEAERSLDSARGMLGPMIRNKSRALVRRTAGLLPADRMSRA